MMDVDEVDITRRASPATEPLTHSHTGVCEDTHTHTWALRDAGKLTVGPDAVRVTPHSLRGSAAFVGVRSKLHPPSPDVSLLCVGEELLGAHTDTRSPVALWLLIGVVNNAVCVPMGTPVMQDVSLRRECVEFLSAADAVEACAALRRIASASTARPRRVLAVVNPHSGDGTANTVARTQVVPLLRAAGIAVDVRLTKYSRHAESMGVALALSRGLTCNLARAEAMCASTVGAPKEDARTMHHERAASPVNPRASPARDGGEMLSPAHPASSADVRVAASDTAKGVGAATSPKSPMATLAPIDHRPSSGWCCGTPCLDIFQSLLTSRHDSDDPVPLPPAFPVASQAASVPSFPAARHCDIPYEGVVAVGGDGTVHELVTGMLDGLHRLASMGGAALAAAGGDRVDAWRSAASSGATLAVDTATALPRPFLPIDDATSARPVTLEATLQAFSEQHHVNAFLPIAAVASGTSNALAVGMGTSSPATACAAIIKRKLRPLDAVEVANADGMTRIALCGIGWGVAGAIAADSEAWRGLGRARYAFLKAKHGAAAGLGLVSYRAKLSYAGDSRFRHPFPADTPSPSATTVPSTALESSPAHAASVSRAAVANVAEPSQPDAASPVTPQRARLQMQAISLDPLAAVSALRGVVSPREEHLRSPGARDAKKLGTTSTAASVESVAHTTSAETATSAAAPYPRLEVCGPQCRECVKQLLPPALAAHESATADIPETTETGAYVTVGIINTVPEARFCHASDGLLDLIIARKGDVLDTAGLMMRYVGSTIGVSDERGSVLYSYVRARSAMLEPMEESGAVGCNVDGEVFPGPAPFRFCLLPQYLIMFGM